jgi:hypothetical protein
MDDHQLSSLQTKYNADVQALMQDADIQRELQRIKDSDILLSTEDKRALADLGFSQGSLQNFRTDGTRGKGPEPPKGDVEPQAPEGLFRTGVVQDEKALEAEAKERLKNFKMPDDLLKLSMEEMWELRSNAPLEK